MAAERTGAEPVGAEHPGDGTWRRLDRRLIHATPFLRLHEDTVITPTGGTTKYGVVECGHCVGVLPFVDDNHVLMVRQHRYLAGRYTWEMPTGGVDGGEPLEAAAQREMAEEAGFRARDLRHVHSIHTSKSCMDETAHLYIGRDLVPDDAQPDEVEDIERRVMPFEDVLQMVLSGEITDSMTVITVLIAARERGA